MVPEIMEDQIMGARVKEIVNAGAGLAKNVAELVFNVADENENPVIDFEQRNFDRTTLQIRTATGGGGTLLVEVTDYEVTNPNLASAAITNKEIYNGISITNVTYQGVDLFVPVDTLESYGDVSDETDINRLQAQIDEILAGVANAGISSIHEFPTYEDRRSSGLIAYAFDNAVSQANYPLLYAEIGDIYEAQHVAAGDSASGAGNFYPTPVPGNYSRSGIPDIELDAGDVNLGSNYFVKPLSSAFDNLRDGTLFKFVGSATMPTTTPQIVLDETYYVRLGSVGVFVFTNEADAIANTNRITIDVDNGSGIFRLTQEGIAIDDAFQGFGIPTASNDASVPNRLDAAGTTDPNTFDADSLVDGGYGTPRISNETRPVTNYVFKYIKAESVTPSGEVISALRYDTGALNKTAWENQQFSIPHNLNAHIEEILIKVFLSLDGVDGSWFEVQNTTRADVNAVTADTAEGTTAYETDLNTIYIQTGADGVRYINNITGGLSIFDASDDRYIRVVIIKPNLVTTVFDVSALPKTYDISSSDIEIVLPEISGVLQTKDIFWTDGDGSNKITITPSGSAKLDFGDALLDDVDGDGTGHISISSDGTNWKVKEYEDSRNVGNDQIIKTKNGNMTQRYFGLSGSGGGFITKNVHEDFIANTYTSGGVSSVSATATNVTVKVTNKQTSSFDYAVVAVNAYSSADCDISLHGRWRT